MRRDGDVLVDLGGEVAGGDWWRWREVRWASSLWLSFVACNGSSGDDGEKSLGGYRGPSFDVSDSGDPGRWVEGGGVVDKARGLA